MAEERIQSFREFWPFYVGEHRSPTCRGLHYVGTSMGTLTMLYAVGTATWWMVPLAFVLGYGPAWVGHFFIENNRPASFKYPLWSLMSDYKMLSLALRGKMADEVRHLFGSASPDPSAPLRKQG